MNVLMDVKHVQAVIVSCPPHWGVDILFFAFFRRPPSGVWMFGFRSFEGKVFILSLPNLVWGFIGLIACMGLLLETITV